MKNKINLVGIALFCSILTFPIYVYAQSEQRKPKKQLSCGCLIHKDARHCGICGTLFNAKYLKKENDGSVLWSYTCSKCGHEHTMSNKYEYYGDVNHKCNLTCLKVEEGKTVRRIYIRNICPQKMRIRIGIPHNGDTIRKTITPNEMFSPNIIFKEKEEIEVLFFNQRN